MLVHPAQTLGNGLDDGAQVLVGLLLDRQGGRLVGIVPVEQHRTAIVEDRRHDLLEELGRQAVALGKGAKVRRVPISEPARDAIVHYLKHARTALVTRDSTALRGIWREFEQLVIDDERPALDELTFLLGRDPRIGEVLGTDSATEALRVLQAEEVDAVFLDIQMPGLTGLDLAQVAATVRNKVQGEVATRFSEDDRERLERELLAAAQRDGATITEEEVIKKPDPPIITTLTPSSAPTTGGAAILVMGVEFGPMPAVMIDETVHGRVDAEKFDRLLAAEH